MESYALVCATREYIDTAKLSYGEEEILPQVIKLIEKEINQRIDNQHLFHLDNQKQLAGLRKKMIKLEFDTSQY